MEWRYLRTGKVKHALRQADHAGAECGATALPASEWRGTGSQHEYETVEQLPPCSRCLRKIDDRPVLRDA